MESIGNLIHKEKEAKRKQKDISQLPDEQLSNCTNGEGSTTDEQSQPSSSTEVTSTQDNKRVDKSRNKQLVQSAEIDDYLTGLIMDNIIDPNYTAWVAKCCYTLSIAVVNRLVIASRNGKDPQRLLAFKLKSAMQLQAKRSFYSEP